MRCMNLPHKYYTVHGKDIAQRETSATTDLFLGAANHSLAKQTHLKQAQNKSFISDTRHVLSVNEWLKRRDKEIAVSNKTCGRTSIRVEYPYGGLNVSYESV